MIYIHFECTAHLVLKIVIYNTVVFGSSGETLGSTAVHLKENLSLFIFTVRMQFSIVLEKEIVKIFSHAEMLFIH